MSDIKMILIVGGTGLKKIIGVFEKYEYNEHSQSHVLVFSNAIMLEEVFVEKGIKPIPMPLAPKKENEKFRIDDRFVVVKPFEPTPDIINMYIKITSNLVIPPGL